MKKILTPLSKPLLLTVVTMGVLLNACGGLRQASSPTPTSTPTATSPSPTASPTPVSSPTTTAQATEGGLQVEKAVLAKSKGIKDGQPELEPAKNNVFKPGDSVYLVMVNVGKFKKGSDGKNHLDMDVEVADQAGKVLLSQKNLLKAKGIVALPNDTAQSPYGNVETKPKTKPGTYVISVTIYDKIGNAKVTRSAEFKLE